MIDMMFGSAVPTTKAWARPVASSSSYLSSIIRISILKMPIEHPAMLHKAEASPAKI